MYFIGVDNGGTMTKAAVFDQTGEEIVAVSASTPILSYGEGCQERDMDELWTISASVIKKAMEKAEIAPSSVAAVGCTGHGKGLYLWGKDNKPAYRAIASTDRRAVAIVKQWDSDGTTEKAREKTLQPILECQPVALLAWLKEREPEVYQNIQWIFEAKDYIRFRLTGKAYAEKTDYSGTSLMNLKTMQLEEELLSLFHLQDVYACLPPLCNSYDLCGTITEEAAICTGLAIGTPVCGGMFDIDACAIAMNVSSPEKLCVITGTWSINEYVSETPVQVNTTTKTSLFCIPGYYLIEESSPTSAGNLDWYLMHCMKWEAEQCKQTGESFYKKVDTMVEEIAPEESNILFLPFLYGTNADQFASSAFVGMLNCHTNAHLVRAIFEGVVFSHRYHIDKLLRFREKPEAIRLAGGAVNSAVWVQMFADVMGMPVEVVPTKELGTLGCAMAGGIAAGIYTDYQAAADAMVKIGKTVPPNEKNHGIYEKKYARYVRLMKLMDKLDSEGEV